MAFDKLIDSVQLEAAITATADAIRAKNNTTDPIEWTESEGFADAVSSIRTGGSDQNAVIFYDYDGTVLYSYSAEEALALTSMPELPTRDGLICQGWNWSLDSMKVCIDKCGTCDIGATYITDDGKTRLYITIAAEGRMDVPISFYQSIRDGVVIDWGDGSPIQTVSGLNNAYATTHTYDEVGEYVITLNPDPTCDLTLGSGSYGIIGTHTSSATSVYQNMLQKVEIGTNVRSIYTKAFYNCYSLTSITIPQGVTSIGDDDFGNCHSLTSITIPQGVTSIGDSAFYNCCSLASIAIPEGVTSIDRYAFRNCYSLTSITIPQGVTSIGAAFDGCHSLTSVTIPQSVTSVNNNAFYNCSSLTSVTIQQGVTSVGNNAFYNCYSLTSIAIPEGVTSIGSSAFYNCYPLTSMAIPESVTSIGDSAFYNCYSLTSIAIPEGVTSIGNSAFYNCYPLTSMAIPESVTSIGNSAFYNCRSLTSITIPEGVTSIGKTAFDSCYSLTSIVIPQGVTSINSNTFYRCYGMTFYDFSSHTVVPTLENSNAFTNIPSDCEIRVPAALYDEWIAATNWSTYASQIVAV